MYLDPRPKVHYLRAVNVWREHNGGRVGKHAVTRILPETLAVGIGESMAHLSYLGCPRPDKQTI